MKRKRTSTFYCMMCKETFADIDNYRRHSKTRHGIIKGNEGWQCPYTSCSLCFPDFAQLSTHGSYAHRKDVMEEEGPVVCMECDSGVFPNQTCYESHKAKMHHKIDPELDKEGLTESHEFQDGSNFPLQHKFGDVYFEKRAIYLDEPTSTSFSSPFWTSSTFVILGNLNEGGGGGAL